jgi:streptogramin lyase
MAYNTFNNGGADGLWSTGANWSLGHKPTTGETALCDGTSDANLTLDENAVCDGFEGTLSYDGNVDFGAGYTHTWGTAGLIVGHAGDTDFGSGTTHNINGDFKTYFSGGGAITANASTFYLAGTDKKWTSKTALIYKDVYVTGSYTTDIQTSANIDNGVFSVTGTLNSPTSGFGIWCRYACDVYLDGTLTFPGNKPFAFNQISSGHGMKSFTGTIDLTAWWHSLSSQGSEFLAGNWNTDYINFYAASGVDCYVAFGAGTTTIPGEVEFIALGSNDDYIDTATNDATLICQGDWRFDVDHVNSLVRFLPGSVPIEFQGSFIDEIDNGGVAANYQSLKLTGTAAQNIRGFDTYWGDIEEDKTANGVTLDDDFNCESYLLTDGDLDLNGNLLLANYSVVFKSGSTVSSLEGSTITCKTLLSEGVSLTGTNTWYLNLEEGGTVRDATITNCDASGGRALDATDNCVDGGGNVNVDFGTRTSYFRDALVVDTAPSFLKRLCKGRLTLASYPDWTTVNWDQTVKAHRGWLGRGKAAFNDGYSQSGSYPTTYQYFGINAGEDGYMVFIPYDAVKPWRLDTADDTSTVFGSFDFTSNKYAGGVLAENGYIYCVPFSSATVLKIDYKNLTTSTFGSAGVTTAKWFGGVLAPNGKIYCCPRNASTVLKIDPSNDTISTFGSLGATASKWAGAVLAPNGKIYCPPGIGASTILKIDPSNDTTSTFGSFTSQHHSGVLAPNGMIYFIPTGTSQPILKLDPSDDSTSTFGSFTGSWTGGALAPNGFIYGAPSSGNGILRIDPTTDTATVYSLISGANPQRGIALAPNGYLYAPHHTSGNILKIGAPFPLPDDAVCSRYWNKL